MMQPDTPAVWLTWERHRRTREIARALDLRLVELTPAAGVWRYPRLLLQTVQCVRRIRPSVLFVQCPSIVLGLVAAVLKRGFGFTLVADLHNEAVEPFNYSSRLYRALVRLIWRGADLCVVTNEPLQRRVERSGARTCVLPDRVPELAAVPLGSANTAGATVVFVCSFAPDEPYLEMIEAARLLGPAVRLAITGNPSRLPASLSLPPNVELTGFLAEDAYVARLRQADAIVDLTRMEDCLVCGGYEAVAVERPLVTSDTSALRAFFSQGTVHTTHEPAALAAAITRALRDRDRLALEMTALKRELASRWSARRDTLQRCLRDLVMVG